MKSFILTACLLATTATAVLAQKFPVTTIKLEGPDTNRINIVYLPDGFQAGRQLDSFRANTSRIQDYVFDITPFKQYKRFFNVYAIDVPSVDSGVDHPGNATDVTEPAFPVATVNTYFNSTFDNGKVHRAVYARGTAEIYSVLNDNFPMYDVPMVLVNTPEYGGTGGNHITFTINAQANETAVHELGHTFGKLQDEYYNGNPRETRNMTQTSAPTSVIWKDWIGFRFNSIGVFAHGTTPPQSTWYRPHQNCKMRYLGSPLCAVCLEAIIDKIYEKVSPIEYYSPANATAVQSSFAGTTFAFSPVLPIPNTIKYSWTLNGNVINTTDTSVQLSESQLQVGENTLVATLTDTTLMSRSNLPGNGYMFSVQWKVNRTWTDVNTVASTGKFTYRLFPVPAKDKVNLYCNNGSAARELKYNIVSMTGAVVQTGTVALTEGEQVIPFDIKGVAAGSYTLSLQGDGVYINTNFITE